MAGRVSRWLVNNKTTSISFLLRSRQFIFICVHVLFHKLDICCVSFLAKKEKGSRILLETCIKWYDNDDVYRSRFFFNIKDIPLLLYQAAAIDIIHPSMMMATMKKPDDYVLCIRRNQQEQRDGSCFFNEPDLRLCFVFFEREGAYKMSSPSGYTRDDYKQPTTSRYIYTSSDVYRLE